MFKGNKTYDNFTPTNIFKKDKDENNVYFQWGEFGNGYIINDPIKKARLIDLEGYKHFFVSYKPPIILPIIVFALIISSGIYFLTDFEGEPKGLMLMTTVVIYLITISIYFYKISKTLRGCQKISKDEKEWIFKNV